MRIRMARKEDAKELLEIYGPYVEKTAITFEYEIPVLQEFENRIERTLKKYPYLVAVEDDRIVGYAYASTFYARAAYDWCVEVSVYIDQSQKGKGYGRRLYQELESILRKQNILNVNACISCTDVEDSYLTNASMNFHAHMGYSLVGKFHQCGYKFGKWYDMIWMEKMIGEHEEFPKPVIAVGNIKD